MPISKVSFEHRLIDFGITEPAPRISWCFDGDATAKLNAISAVTISHSANSADSFFVPWPAGPLSSAQSVSVRARAHSLCLADHPSTPWSDWIGVETGLLDADDWIGVETGLLDADDWIGASPITAHRQIGPSLPKPPLAHPYNTALGMCKAQIHGTALVRAGAHAIAVNRNFYGDSIGLFTLLVVAKSNGTVIYDGEKHNSKGRRVPARTSPAGLWGDRALESVARLRGCRYAPRAVPGTKGRIDKGVWRRGDGLWDTDQYGDWVDPKSPLDAPSETTTAKHRVAHAFLVHRTQVALGQGRQAAHYDAEHEQLGQLVDDTWIINGSLANRTHTRRLRCRTRAAVAALQPCVDLPGHALRGIQSTVYSYALLLQTTVPRGSTTHTDTTFFYDEAYRPLPTVG
ncbi:hypothetical protein B0T11DRAFT_330676 [Plectosphaerella cucumerina]|uniref:Uncharacterized protein n=1 Tax=Plectosphaerella cucumerina TaxID=40658 RepID=A0A8K0TE63_9PEZI|nr:hypothetical protein B0T11DRAFT_330676 [Plectosphaerella cucumerina]